MPIAQLRMMTMSDKPWLFPVCVICTRTNQTLKVGTTREAWRMLLDMWPIADGHKFLSALKICMDVEHGIGEPADARDAFIAAAKEAGVTIEGIKRRVVRRQRGTKLLGER